MLDKYFKVGKEVTGGFVDVILFNPDTKDIKEIRVDDMEYQKNYYSSSSRDKLRVQEINAEAQELYNIHLNIIRLGGAVEVVKGRKYDKGTKGIVKRLYNYYKNVYAEVLTENRELIRINTNNLKTIVKSNVNIAVDAAAEEKRIKGILINIERLEKEIENIKSRKEEVIKESLEDDFFGAMTEAEAEADYKRILEIRYKAIAEYKAEM